MSVVGYRWWRVAPDGALMSWAFNDIWLPDEPMTARCSMAELGETLAAIDPEMKDEDAAWHASADTPDEDCGCGLWAFYDPEIAQGLLYKRHMVSKLVFGVVEGWGGVVWHDLGFRAEFAQVRALVPNRHLHDAYRTVPWYANVEELLKVWDVSEREMVE